MNEEGTRCMRPTGDGEEGAEGDCKGRVTGLLPVACCRPSPPPAVSAVCTAMSNNVNRHSARKYHIGRQAGRQIYGHGRERERTALEPFGWREWHAKWDGREGRRDGRVSHAIGKGNERALHVQLLHTDALRRRDGRGRGALFTWMVQSRGLGRASEVSQGVSPSARGTRALDDGRGERVCSALSLPLTNSA